MLANGLSFTIASARSYHSIKPILNGLPFKLPIIEFNGSFITDFATGRHLVINHIEPEIINRIFAILIKRKVEPFVSSFNGVDDKLYYKEIINDGMNWYVNDKTLSGDNRLTRVKRFPGADEEQIVCINTIGRIDELEDIKAELGEHINNSTEIQLLENPYNKGWYWLTIHAERASKDIAIKQILDMYGFSEDELTVFGDNTNDIKMFKLAAQSIAVGNACNELKAIADEIIDGNESDAVVKYLEKQFGLE